MCHGEVLQIDEALAVVPLSDEICYVLLHGRPVVPLPKALLGESSCSKVVLAYPLMDFSEYVVSLVWPHALEKGE